MAGRTALLHWNRAPAPPVRMSADLAREIRDTLHEDRMELSRLLGRDLGHWLGGPRLKGAKGEDAA